MSKIDLDYAYVIIQGSGQTFVNLDYWRRRYRTLPFQEG